MRRLHLSSRPSAWRGLPHASARGPTAWRAPPRAPHTRPLASIALYELEGKGRALLAEANICAGATLLQCVPIAKELKATPHAAAVCTHCLGPRRAAPRAGFCSEDCAAEYSAAGGDLLERCDLRALHAVHAEQNRRFPLLVARLLASLLEGLRRSGEAPAEWQHAMALCHAVIPDDAMAQVKEEHAALVAGFTSAGVSDAQSLQLLLPLERYTQLLGAAQLNAFELQTSRGVVISCLLPSVASCFNHSCEPNVLVSCGETHQVSFVAGREISEGEELCISYAPLDLDYEARQQIFKYKYAFTCTCSRCAEECPEDKPHM
ncbi:hypothetical protein AB1Y20_000174 [Prymnesium parvum]|uniref:SET domain-containing protein n=1 Tax=Prymnesium parvum TaxID=97485 RepID=A0AB34K3V2_PRYPA